MLVVGGVGASVLKPQMLEFMVCRLENTDWGARTVCGHTKKQKQVWAYLVLQPDTSSPSHAIDILDVENFRGLQIVWLS
jgi:hypothetical protein